MCTVNVKPNAEQPLADLLGLLVAGLARSYGVDPSAITVGPVDFGTELDTATGR